MFFCGTQCRINVEHVLDQSKGERCRHVIYYTAGFVHKQLDMKQLEVNNAMHKLFITR